MLLQTHLMREDQGELDFVGNGFGIATSRVNKSFGYAAANSRGETEGRHVER